MLSRAIQSRRTSAGSRRGVSFVEFIGCLVAVAGGVVLGSSYMGVDVETMAATVLEKAEIEVPEFLGVEVAPSDEAANGEASADAGEEVEGELPYGLSSRSDSEGALSTNQESSAKTSAPIVLSEVEQQAATQACWRAMNQIVQVEVAHRRQSVASPSSWQLFDYLSLRKTGHEAAVESLEGLKLEDVDQRLRVHVQDVLTWQRSGAELYARAAQLLTDAPAGKLTGPYAQSWQSAATQHRMEEKLVFNKHAAVKSYLEHAAKTTAQSE